MFGESIIQAARYVGQSVVQGCQAGWERLIAGYQARWGEEYPQVRIQRRSPNGDEVIILIGISGLPMMLGLWEGPLAFLVLPEQYFGAIGGYAIIAIVLALLTPWVNVGLSVAFQLAYARCVDGVVNRNNVFALSQDILYVCQTTLLAAKSVAHGFRNVITNEAAASSYSRLNSSDEEMSALSLRREDRQVDHRTGAAQQRIMDRFASSMQAFSEQLDDTSSELISLSSAQQLITTCRNIRQGLPAELPTNLDDTADNIEAMLPAASLTAFKNQRVDLSCPIERTFIYPPESAIKVVPGGQNMTLETYVKYRRGNDLQPVTRQPLDMEQTMPDPSYKERLAAFFEFWLKELVCTPMISEKGDQVTDTTNAFVENYSVSVIGLYAQRGSDSDQFAENNNANDTDTVRAAATL